MATRIALGAGRLQLIRQTLMESVLLSLSGALLGIPLAYSAIRVITRLAPADLPRIQEVGMNTPLLAGALGLSSVIGIAAGLIPALHIAYHGNQIAGLLRQGASSGISARGSGLRRVLVIGEVALAVILLAGAGLLIRSFASLSKIDLGYDPRGVIAFQVVVPPGRDSSAAEFYANVISGLESIPGVEAAGATDVLPIAGASSYHFVLEGLPTPPGSGNSMVMRLVSPNYFRAMGIRVLSGRTFSESATRTREVLLNEEFSQRYFGKANPIGRIVGRGYDAHEVVGIVANVRHEGFHGDVQPEYYVDLRHSGLVASMRPYVVLRSSRTSSELLPAVRAVVRQLDPQAGVGADVTAMADIVSESISRPRFNAAILSAFATIAIVLAAIAIYGVMTFAVTQRSREIGVRVALGARRTDVIALVLRQSAVMTGTGILLGVVGALAFTRYMQAMLFGVTPLDMATFVTVPLAFVAVAMLASLAPVRRATKVDPVLALRMD